MGNNRYIKVIKYSCWHILQYTSMIRLLEKYFSYIYSYSLPFSWSNCDYISSRVDLRSLSIEVDPETGNLHIWGTSSRNCISVFDSLMC